MTDIVERLKIKRDPFEFITAEHGFRVLNKERAEAAAEIERLRAALHKVLGIVGNFPVDRFEYNVIKAARTALGEKE